MNRVIIKFLVLVCRHVELNEVHFAGFLEHFIDYLGKIETRRGPVFVQAVTAAKFLNFLSLVSLN
jgi:hypothetical protein